MSVDGRYRFAPPRLMPCLQCPPPPPISGLLALPPPCRRRRELPPSSSLYYLRFCLGVHILLVIVDISLAFLYFSVNIILEKNGREICAVEFDYQVTLPGSCFLCAPDATTRVCTYALLLLLLLLFLSSAAGERGFLFGAHRPNHHHLSFSSSPLLQHRKAHTSTPKKPWWCSRRLCSGGGWGSIRTKSGFLKK